MTTPVITVRPNDSLAKINALLHAHDIHHVVVVDDNKLLAGMVSDRDVLRALSPFLGTSAENRLDRSTREKTAWQLMTPNPVVVTPKQSIQEAASLLLQRNVSCLPVVNVGSEPVGMLSWKDILRVIARAKA